ncbi:uncharacterized protein LOC120632320 [Pararge aegeria]|uniref:Jg10241 protein n=1 Tax=Pararge aegeria aegeria TaxID=348720 RepID=A0A8S4S9Z4_9NEOP|nr:uncharacterized protein LOC120632320 [Pararge aegeria]CAH2250881.1 jg10241 [Pararge aegeria aegeria]
MHQLLAIILLVSTTCLAHYRSYDSHNLIERDEPRLSDGILVECPVCEQSPSGIPTREVCDIPKGNKMYKKCRRGTYINEICGNRLDCYRGPGEQCTEKMDYDYYGQKCARTFNCDGLFHECIGLGYTPDSRQRFFLSQMHSGIYGQAKKNDLRENSLMLYA